MKKLIEKPEQLFTEDAYTIYRQCMYKPTYEDYRNKINNYMKNKNTKIFVCVIEDKVAGIIVLMQTGDESAEVLGIAVHDSLKKQGIGNFMLRESANTMNLHRITAETDDGAVEFYKKAGFHISKEIKYYGDERVVRYHCSLA